MSLLTNSDSKALWYDVIKHAQAKSAIQLNADLEIYLISLLIRYMDKPEVAQQIFAKAFLDAQQKHAKLQLASMQNVGDQCLLYAGLFPHVAERRNVKIRYFVDIGRAAYISISTAAGDIFGSLAIQFVVVMDVLQSIREHSDLLPLEAYEQWTELGSLRAYQILQGYTLYKK